MTTAADVAAAITAIKLVQTDLLPQTTSAANAASASKLQGAQTAASTALQWMNDCTALTVGF